MLKEESIMLIGERYPTRVVWIQLYDASDRFEEEDIRDLLIAISTHIAKGRIPSGSARKFLDGKLIYFEPSGIQEKEPKNKVYAIFTKELDIRKPVKKAVEAIALRGGVYSAKRFFSETIDLLENPKKMRDFSQISINEALLKIESFNIDHIDLNELGYLISLVDRSTNLDHSTLERIYFHVYSAIDHLSDGHDHDQDPDEFLDAAYLVALRYLETNNFHLALELFKSIIPVASRNDRYDLEVACRVRIGTIYKEFFPMSGEYILQAMKTITNDHLSETNNKMLEMYYCLLGHAHEDLDKSFEARKYYQKAIDVAAQEINSPIWIAKAYNYLGSFDEERHLLKDANRHYLTAATLSFNAGELTDVSNYRNNASKVEIHISNSLMHAALVHRMEGDHKDAEFRAWEALRILVKSYSHSSISDMHMLEELTDDILYHASIILDIKGKSKKNLSILKKLQQTIEELQTQTITPGTEHEQMEKLAKEIEENIPLPPPTLLMLTLDGRLMTMGRIEDDGWEESEIEGTLLSGVLAAIMSLITEVADDSSSLRTVDAGNTQIMIEQSDNIVVALLVDRDIQEFRNRLVRLLNFIDNHYGDDLRFWNGNTKIFGSVKTYAQKLLAPGIIAARLDD